VGLWQENFVQQQIEVFFFNISAKIEGKRVQILSVGWWKSRETIEAGME